MSVRYIDILQVALISSPDSSVGEVTAYVLTV